jgi:hypothetical protein
VSRYKQPWERVELGGKRCRMQILDPLTAFKLEQELAAALGDELCMVIAAPGQVLGGVWAGASIGSARNARELAALSAEPVGKSVAARSLELLALTLARCLMSARPDPAWAVGVWESCVLDRLRVDGEVIEDGRDWAELRWSPLVKWRAMAAQVRQTFGPLWTRSHYKLRSTAKDHGVPEPDGVPQASRWADELARAGHARSKMEILYEWTPVDMIDTVEGAAYTAERERRAYAATKG